MNNIQTCAIKEPHSHLVHGQTFECEKGVFMNQPIQENKERCQNCGMRIEDFRETGQFYCDEEGKQRHDFPPQNTSREEIREKFNKLKQYLSQIYPLQHITPHPQYELDIEDFIHTEIALARQSAFSQVRDALREQAEPYDGAKWHNNLSLETIEKVISQLQKSSK